MTPHLTDLPGIVRCELTATDQRNDFQLVFRLQDARRVLRARHQFAVAFDRHETRLKPQLLDKLRKRQAFGHRLRFSVDRDIQGGHFGW